MGQWEINERLNGRGRGQAPKFSVLTVRFNMGSLGSDVAKAGFLHACKANSYSSILLSFLLTKNFL